MSDVNGSLPPMPRGAINSSVVDVVDGGWPTSSHQLMRRRRRRCTISPTVERRPAAPPPATAAAAGPLRRRRRRDRPATSSFQQQQQQPIGYHGDDVVMPHHLNVRQHQQLYQPVLVSSPTCHELGIPAAAGGVLCTTSNSSSSRSGVDAHFAVSQRVEDSVPTTTNARDEALTNNNVVYSVNYAFSPMPADDGAFSVRPAAAPVVGVYNSPCRYTCTERQQQTPLVAADDEHLLTSSTAAIRHQNSAVVIPTAFIHRRNERERERVRCVNEAYETLRCRVPDQFDTTKQQFNTTHFERRASKVDTLRSASRYIRYLVQLLGDDSRSRVASAGTGAADGGKQRSLDGCSAIVFDTSTR